MGRNAVFFGGFSSSVMFFALPDLGYSNISPVYNYLFGLPGKFLDKARPMGNFVKKLPLRPHFFSFGYQARVYLLIPFLAKFALGRPYVANPLL